MNKAALVLHWSWPATRCVGGDCQISRLGMSHSHCFAPSHATLSLWICHFLYFPLTLNLFRYLTSSHTILLVIFQLFYSFNAEFSSSQRSLWFSEICWQTRLDWKETWCIPIHTIRVSSQQSDLQNFQFWPRYFRLDPVGPPLDPLGPCGPNP